jgi:hypothetical protein
MISQAVGKHQALRLDRALGAAADSWRESVQDNFRVVRHPPRIADSPCGDIRNYIGTRHFWSGPGASWCVIKQQPPHFVESAFLRRNPAKRVESSLVPETCAFGKPFCGQGNVDFSRSQLVM